MKKMIGVCTTKVNEEFSRNYIYRLHKATAKENYSLTVFHSVYDFFRVNEENGSKEIFRMIPFERLSALVILRDSIYDKELLDGIIGSAKEAGIPVIMARGRDERCISLIGHFEDAYRELLRSVITEQKITDTFFIAGREENDIDSVNRINIYKEILAENGIAFDESRVAYGGYWERPSAEIINRLINENRVPRAIFCANDIMAFTVMEILLKKGYRIPEDVIVTGFDGLEHSIYTNPALSTCFEDTAALAELTVDTISKLNNGDALPAVLSYPYNAVITESSDKNGKREIKRTGTRIFRRMRTDELDERDCNLWLDNVIAFPNMTNLKNSLPAMINESCSAAVRADAFFDEKKGETAPEEYLLITAGNDGIKHEKLTHSDAIINGFMDSITPERAGFISMISRGDFIYGTAFNTSDDLLNESGRIHRYVMTLNRALLVGISGERQRKVTSLAASGKYIDALTGLRNIDGANKWFADIVRTDYIHNQQLSVGVYTFINYQKMFDIYGVSEIEDGMQYIARCLTMANPKDAVIARISVDSFAVLIVQNATAENVNTVDKSIGLFYGYLEMRNKNAEDDARIEVSCGYTDAIPPWNGKLTDYINAATSNLYLNRMTFSKKAPKSLDINDGAQMLEMQQMFFSLIKNNLFNYHFQPIIDAHTGEVIAYEALMRTAGNIKMSPLDVLSAAEMFSKLDYIEFATFSNIFKRFSESQDEFGNRQVFINTIPGHFLPPEICADIKKKYGDLLSHMVIEITESETISVDELDSIRTFCGNLQNVRIAVDDYGTGHSNIVNLMEYKPQIVKIDRYLITNIQSDKNKQMFVKNLIEFAGENSIRVLAEGVETEEEMNTVIDFGVDLIQGYYTGRPSDKIITEIDPEIKAKITARSR